MNLHRPTRPPWCLRHHLLLMATSASSHLGWLHALDPFAAVRECPRCQSRRPGRKSHS